MKTEDKPLWVALIRRRSNSKAYVFASEKEPSAIDVLDAEGESLNTEDECLEIYPADPIRDMDIWLAAKKGKK